MFWSRILYRYSFCEFDLAPKTVPFSKWYVILLIKEGETMKKRCDVGQIVRKLREAEVSLGQGLNVGEMCIKVGISDNTYPSGL